MISSRRPFRPCLETLEDRCTPTTYTVQNLNDSGAGSLRQMILNANNHAGADTIVFKSGLEGTISLFTGELAIGDSLVLAGPGSGKITIDANRIHRIFTINNSANTVTIKDLTLINGRSASGAGGAINSAASKFTLVRTVLSGNEANGEGGAVSAVSSQGAVVIDSCTISGNRAGSGGGISTNVGSNATARISNCRIINNTATLAGGGLLVLGATTITSSVVSGNTVGVRGGGIYSPSGNLTVQQSTLSGNEAIGGDGGGLYARYTVANLTLDRGTLIGNVAGRHGGGLHTEAGLTILSGTKVTLNRAATSGGGLLAHGTTQVLRSSVSGNTAVNGDGGGIAQGDNLTSTYLTLRDSTIADNRGRNGLGGGVFIANTSKSSLIERSTISGNRAGAGGGLWVTTSPSFLIRNSTISGNVAQGDAGGIGTDTAGTIRNSTIAFNRAGLSGTGRGGGIANLDVGTVLLESTIVAFNLAPTGPEGPELFGNFSVKQSLLFGGNAGGTLTDDGGNVFGEDPRLAPLAANGGPTRTHALRAGSPALNKGYNPSGVGTDQRGTGFLRNVGGVDIGAFERQ